MKIKELIKILQSAPDRDRDVYIPGEDYLPSTNIVYNFDDNNDLDLGIGCEK